MRWVRTGIALFPLGVLLAGSCAPAPQPPVQPVATASASAPAQASPPIASAAEPTPVASAAEPTPVASAAAPRVPAPVLHGYRIDPAALVGCRAPDEPGCGMCCDNDGGSCERLSGFENWAAYPDIEPWYNSRSIRCPQDCPPCARCTRRSERELADLMPFRCDCAKTKIGVDPCFDPGSCACECQHRARVVQACPRAP